MSGEYRLRLWSRVREREHVTARWLTGEVALPRYADVPTTVARWWCFRALDAVLAQRHTAVVVAHPEHDPAACSGFCVYQQPAGHPGPMLFWLHVERLERRRGVARLILQHVLGEHVECVTTTAINTQGALALRAARPKLITVLHNPFPFWEAAAAARRTVGTEKFQRRLLRALVHAGFVPAHGNSRAVPLDAKERTRV